jgi:hypothetical protein
MARAKSSASRASGSQASSDSGSRLNHSFIGVPKDVLAHTSMYGYVAAPHRGAHSR